MRMRLKPEQRRSVLVAVAVEIANERGLKFVSCESVADACDVVVRPSTVRHYFPTRADLWSAVISDPGAADMVRDEAKRYGITA